MRPTHVLCEDRIGMGPPRAKTEVIHIDLGFWAISTDPRCGATAVVSGGVTLSRRMYSSVNLRKATHPQNRHLIIYCC